MNTSLVVAFILLGASLLFSLLIYVQYWRSGEPVPVSQHGGTAASIGMCFLMAAISMDFEDGMAIVCFILSAIFSIGSAVIGSRALRQMKSRRQ